MRVIKDERGLTLIEVLAGVLIMSIIVLAFSQISGYTMNAVYQSDKKATALQIAEEQLQKARDHALAYQELPENTNVSGYIVTFQQTDLTDPDDYDTDSFGEHHISLQAVVLIHSSPKLLTVTVSWDK